MDGMGKAFERESITVSSAPQEFPTEVYDFFLGSLKILLGRSW